jgi:structure-specific recognition protein 1
LIFCKYLLKVKGRLKMTESSVVFKNSKTGKLESLQGSDIDVVTWQRFTNTWGLRIFTKPGNLLRFGGLKETDKEKASLHNII